LNERNPAPEKMDLSPDLTHEDTPKETPKEDLYLKYKALQKQLEFLETQEEYLKDDMKVNRTVDLRAPLQGRSFP